MNFATELKSCPVIMHGLYSLWGTDDVVEFIDNVMFTTHDSTKSKYPFAVMTDLLLLRSIHVAKQGVQDADPWQHC